jgi:DNA-binding NarL/FixJ family response regulator
VSTSVLVVDDSRPFLDAARVLLEREGMAVAGLASTSASALRETAQLRPDVVLVDIALAGESGFELAQRLAELDHGEPPAVILISTHAEADFAELIAASPACGFVPKAELSAERIRRILDGR